MSTLGSTYPWFIRCIIPNHEQKQEHLEDTVVLDQLRCNGVLEGIRIARKGFPNRVTYPEFLKRYHLLAKNIPRVAPDPRGAVASVLDELKVDPAQYRFGVTKVFFKAGVLAKIEEIREKKIGELLIVIQSAARAFLARQMYKRMTEKTVAIRIIQRNIRAWASFKSWTWWKLFAKARPMLKRRNFEKEIEDKAKQVAELTVKIQEETKARVKIEETMKELEVSVNELQTKLKKEHEMVSELFPIKQLSIC